ncbi:hypothetical protein AB0G32_37055 [Streptomyces sp. NPDC023723]|uniref:hypothetical protein n=1 Tax=Streptomyces sp. NPDC023723 TaxID=3154323 RepID=UPI0033C1AC28
MKPGFGQPSDLRDGSQRRVLRSAAMALGAALSLVAAPLLTSGTASAVAWEQDYATPYAGDNPGCDYLSPGPQDSLACFVKYGDVLGVTYSDWFGDPMRTSVQWTNRLKNASGQWVTYRQGECFNDNGFSSYWSVCNKDFYESSSLNALGGRGSQLQIKACRLGVCASPSAWIDNNG